MQEEGFCFAKRVRQSAVVVGDTMRDAGSPAAQPGAFICAPAHTASGVVPGKHSIPATGDESLPEAPAILIALA